MPLYRYNRGSEIGESSLYSFDPGSNYLPLEGGSYLTGSYPLLAGKPGFPYDSSPSSIDSATEAEFTDGDGGTIVLKQNFNGTQLFKYNATTETLYSSDDGGQTFNINWTASLPASPLVGLMYNKLNPSNMLMLTSTEIYELDVAGPSTTLLSSIADAPSGVISAWQTMTWVGNRLAITSLKAAPFTISVSSPNDLTSFAQITDATNSTGTITSISGDVFGALLVAYDSGYDVAPVTVTTDLSTFGAAAAGELSPGQTHYVSCDITSPVVYVNTPGIIGVSVNSLSSLVAPAGAAPFPLDSPVSVVPTLAQFGWIQTNGFVAYTFDALLTNASFAVSYNSTVKDVSYTGDRFAIADTTNSKVYSYEAVRPVAATFTVATLSSPDSTFKYYVRAK